jgi:D-3-phosphoglycerate dehydrogenase
LLGGEFEVDVRLDLASASLVEAIAGYDALIVRSQTKVTADVIEAADRLTVVGRAGIGLDNVDVEAATRRVRDDQPYRPRRPVLGAGRRC